ncbi:hypothetical protein E2C01_054488 [Portunus trituberculatus]|uniref:Uncharacterized protein n=1 Tax=Portunus trituberculatus TaxID=210409 RepID=A0A5B7GS72_PORTR|nr:hypothetical protein [Portunus trituberculatus]
MRNIMDKCKDQPLFYKYINGKLKNKEVISRIKVGDDMNDNTKEMAEVFNRSFQSVLAEEDDFKRERLRADGENYLKETVVTVEEVKDILEGLDARKDHQEKMGETLRRQQGYNRETMQLQRGEVV